MVTNLDACRKFVSSKVLVATHYDLKRDELDRLST